MPMSTLMDWGSQVRTAFEEENIVASSASAEANTALNLSILRELAGAKQEVILYRL